VEAFDTAAKATARIVNAADFAIINYDGFARLDLCFHKPHCAMVISYGRFHLRERLEFDVGAEILYHESTTRQQHGGPRMAIPFGTGAE
jgi:hypothetical protein